MVGREGRYRSVDSGTNALKRARKTITPFLPRYVCLGAMLMCEGSIGVLTVNGVLCS